MYFSYNNLTQPLGATMVSIPEPSIERDSFGFRSKIIVTWKVMWEIIGTDQADLTRQLIATERAYNRDGGDAILYHSSGGGISAHSMLSRNTLQGVKSGLVYYPDGEGAEYATGRRCALTLTAEYAPVFFDGAGGNPNQQQPTLLQFEERVNVTGNGGPRRVVIETLNTEPIHQQTNKFTLVRATQSGSATGYSEYPAVPPPIWPQWLQNESESIERSSPKESGDGKDEKKNRTTYEISWNYQFLSPRPLKGYPTRRTR